MRHTNCPFPVLLLFYSIEKNRRNLRLKAFRVLDSAKRTDQGLEGEMCSMARGGFVRTQIPRCHPRVSESELSLHERRKRKEGSDSIVELAQAVKNTVFELVVELRSKNSGNNCFNFLSHIYM